MNPQPVLLKENSFRKETKDMRFHIPDVPTDNAKPVLQKENSFRKDTADMRFHIPDTPTDNRFKRAIKTQIFNPEDSPLAQK